jgi:hypothetical protein
MVYKLFPHTQGQEITNICIINKYCEVHKTHNFLAGRYMSIIITIIVTIKLTVIYSIFAYA